MKRTIYRGQFSDTEPFEARTTRPVRFAWRWLATRPKGPGWKGESGAADSVRAARRAINNSILSNCPTTYHIVSEEVVRIYPIGKGH